jgi:hypothetical protein
MRRSIIRNDHKGLPRSLIHQSATSNSRSHKKTSFLKVHQIGSSKSEKDLILFSSQINSIRTMRLYLMRTLQKSNNFSKSIVDMVLGPIASLQLKSDERNLLLEVRSTSKSERHRKLGVSIGSLLTKFPSNHLMIIVLFSFVKKIAHPRAF